MFASVEARSIHRKALEALICPVIARTDRGALVEALSSAGIPCGPINNFDEVFDDPQVLHSKMIIDFAQDGQKNIRVVRNPLNLSRTPAQYRSRPPTLGEHTHEILQKQNG